MQVPSENLDGAGRIDGEELGFGASEAPFELRALEIALDVVRAQKCYSCTCCRSRSRSGTESALHRQHAC